MTNNSITQKTYLLQNFHCKDLSAVGTRCFSDLKHLENSLIIEIHHHQQQHTMGKYLSISSFPKNFEQIKTFRSNPLGSLIHCFWI